MRRWLRVLVCLLLVCCILVNISPLRADATAAGLAGTIFGASAVSVPAALVVGASAIALGVMADSLNPLVFESVVNSAVDTMSTATNYIKDGTVELLRTVDGLGNQAFYIAGQFLEDLRSWFIDSETLFISPAGVTFIPANQRIYSAADETSWTTYSAPCYGFLLTRGGYGTYKVIFNPVKDMSMTLLNSSGTNSTIYPSSTGYATQVETKLSDSRISYYQSLGWPLFTCSSTVTYSDYVTDIMAGKYDYVFDTSYDLSLGQISTVPIDGTSALDWAPDVADRNGLYVKYNNDPEPPDDNNGKWFWKLALPVTAATLLAMSQYDEWTGETPQEFSDYTTSQEFEILDAPEIDGYQGVEIAVPGTGGGTAGDGDSGDDSQESTDPTTSPGGSPGTGGDTGTDTGGDSNPDSGSESDPDADPDTDPDTDPDADPDGSDSSGSGSWQPPSDHNQFALADLSKFFPFCIPFDLYDFFTLLNADPVAPVLSWEITDLAGQTYSLDVDLSQWDSVAQLFRRLQLFLFITGLAAASRKFIKW